MSGNGFGSKNMEENKIGTAPSYKDYLTHFNFST